MSRHRSFNCRARRGFVQLAFAVVGLSVHEGLVGSGRGSLREHRLYFLRCRGILVRLVVALMGRPLKRHPLARLRRRIPVLLAIICPGVCRVGGKRFRAMSSHVESMDSKWWAIRAERHQLVHQSPASRISRRIVPGFIRRVRSTSRCRGESSGKVMKSSRSTSSRSASMTRVGIVGRMSPFSMPLRCPFDLRPAS